MLATTSISAAEIKVIASNGVKEALHELAPAFEARRTQARHLLRPGNRPEARRSRRAKPSTSHTPAPYRRPREAGQGGRGCARRIARSGVGIESKKARASRIRTPGRSSAPSSPRNPSLGEEGQSGIYFASLLERIGIAEQMKSKSSRLHRRRSRQTRRQRASPARLILVNELMVAPASKSWGRCPGAAELHRLPCRRRRGLEGLVAAKALIKFLTTPAAGAVFRRKGQERGKTP